MKKIISTILMLTMLCSVIVPQSILVSAASNELIASENVVLQNIASAYTANTNLRVKNQAKATERVSFIKFDYTEYDIDTMESVVLNLYAKDESGVGKEEVNKIRLNWSSDTTWSASNNAIKYETVNAYKTMTEIGEQIIQIPSMTDKTNQKYWEYDVTGAVKENYAAGNKSITFILKQDRMTTSNGGMDFASISESGKEPKLVFKEGKVPEKKTVLVSEDITLQSNSSAYTEANLLVKNQPGATQRVIMLKFDYSDIDTNKYGKVLLDLYALYRNSGTGKDNPNILSVYWSPTVDTWNENTTSWSNMLTDITEVGDDIISLPMVGAASDTNLNKYYSYDISSAIANNTNSDKKITIIIKQDVAAGVSGGYTFACRESGDNVAPKLTFVEGSALPEAHIKNSVVIAANSDSELDMSSPDTNYGAEEIINVSKSSSAIIGFNLSGYVKSQIAGAGLRVYIKDADAYNNTILKVSLVNGVWDEATVSGSNAPSEVKAYTNFVVEARKGTGYWVDIDISSLIAAASDLSKLSLKVEQLSTEAAGFTFLSTETSNGSVYVPHIVIRPEFTETADKTASAEVVADTYVRYDNTSSMDYSDVNFSGDSEMWVKMNSGADRKAFIKFDLSSTNVITDNICAELDLYYKEKAGTGSDEETTIEVYYCPDSNWEEETLTAANALSMVSASYKPEHLVGTLTLGKSNVEKGYHSIDLGRFIGSHINDSYTRNVTFMIVQKNVAGSNGGITIATKENGTPAKINIYPDIPAGYIAKPISADAYVRFGTYANKNYGSEEILDVKNYSDESSVRELYIKADLSDKPSNAGDKTYLIMPVKHQNLGTVNLKIYGAMLDWEYSAWAEGALTANNVSSNIIDPDEMTFIGDYQVKKSNIGKYVIFDVSDYVTEAIEDYAAEEITFRIIENDEINVNNIIQFYSRESMYKPMIAYGTDKTPVELVNVIKTKTDEGITLTAGLETEQMKAEGEYIVNAAQRVMVVAAGYDANNALTDVYTDELMLDENRYPYEKKLAGAEDAKLFVWDGIGTMKPVDSVEITDEKDMPLPYDYYDDKDIGEFDEEISAELANDTTDWVGEREKTVVAVLMLNQRSAFYSGSWRHWNNSASGAGEYSYVHYPSIVDEETGLRDIAASAYPSIGLFDISDPDYIDYQLQLLKMAGVDAVSINIHGGYDNETWKLNIIKNVYVPKLNKYGIKAFARVDGYTADGYTDENLNEMITMFGDAILKIDERPVISFFNNPTERGYITGEWKAAYNDKYKEEPFIMCWSDSSRSNLGGYDGIYNWTGTDYNGNMFEVTEEYERYYDVEAAKKGYVSSTNTAKEQVKNAIAGGKTLNYLADGVSPGFDNRPVMGWGGKNSVAKVERGENGEVYKYRWTNAVCNNFPMVMIPTWDDWSEGTQIMPTLENGNLELLITRHYVAQYKGEGEDTTADFNIADMIYKIRKTTDDASVIVDMETASDYIADGNYNEAKSIVKPYAFSMKLANVNGRFSY